MSLIYYEWTKWTCRYGALTKRFIRLRLQNPPEETLQGFSNVIRTQIVLRWLFSDTRKACPITSNLFFAVHDTASPVSSKEKVHIVVYALWDHFPHHVLMFSLLIKLLKRIHRGPCQASLLYPPPLLFPPVVTIHGSRQLRPIWVTREHSLGYRFPIQSSKHAVISSLLPSGIQYSDMGQCEPEDEGVSLHDRAHGQIYTLQLKPH